MTFYLLTYLAFSCPGWFGGKLIPGPLRPMVCQQEARREFFTSKAQAYRETEELACTPANPKLELCKGFRCKEKKISCTTKIAIE